MFKISEEFLSRKHLNYLRCRVNCLHFNHNLYQANYYDILGVDRTASQKEIKDQYLKLCKIHHPDTSTDLNLSKEEKVKKFQKINEAYQCLSKIESKAAYDQYGTTSSVNNPYYNANRTTYRARAYPKRPDGYRPFDRQTNEEWFRNRNFYEHDPFEEYFKAGNRRPNLRDFEERMRSQKSATEIEMRSIRIFVYVVLAVVFYILSVRIYILSNYQKQAFRTKFANANDPEKTEEVHNNSREDRIIFDPERGRYVRFYTKDDNKKPDDDIQFTGYNFQKGEKFVGKSNALFDRHLPPGSF